MRRSRWIRVRGYLKSSLWVVPLIAIPLGMFAVRILHGLDGYLAWTPTGFVATELAVTAFGVTGARALLDAIITSTLSFVVFTFGSLLVAIQVASGQMTPRIIATVLLRNNVVRYTVGLFIFTFMVAVGTHGRLDDKLHPLSLVAVSCLGIACFAAFFDRLRLEIAPPDLGFDPSGKLRICRDRERVSRTEPRSRCSERPPP